MSGTADPESPAVPLPLEPSTGARAVAGENLAIMFTDIVGFTARTARQSREENARMLATHDRLLLPVVRAFHGRRIKSIGDALLLVFRSPTDSVLCGMAIQDRLARHNAGVPEPERLVVRVAINLGEVRIERGDVFGEPVNVAARVEAETPAGAVWFTEAVFLSMNRNEVEAEEVGLRALRGIPVPVRLFRARAGAGPLPFGGRALQRVSDRPALLAGLAPLLDRARGMTLPDPRPALARARRVVRSSAHMRWTVAVGALLVVALGAGWTWERNQPLARAERALDSGDYERALRESDRAGRTAESLILRGRAQHLLKRPGDGIASYLEAAGKDTSILSREEVLGDLSEDLGGNRSQDAAEVLVKVGKPAIRPLLDATKDAQSYKRRWAAVEALRKLNADDQVDLRGVFLSDLRTRESCSAVSRAAARLADLGETRAIEPLREISQRRNLFGLGEPCEVPAARSALKKLEKR